MSVHREKISKDEQRFIDRFGRDPRHLQLLFLSDAEKSCDQIAAYSIKLQSFCPPPRKHHLGAAQLANSLKTMVMLLYSKIMAMLIAYLKRSTLRQ